MIMEAFKANKATWEAKEESDEHAAAGGGAEAPEQFQKGADTTAAAVSDDDDELTGVENVRYGTVTNHGAAVKPATPALAQRQALTSGSTSRFGGDVEELEDEDEVNNYEELIAMLKRRMEAKKPLTPEEEARLKRRERTQGMIAGISDMAQALSNLFFTSQYAPDMYDPKEGMGAKAQERFDKAKAQREADDAEYLNYALQLGRARDAVAAVRERKEQQRAAAAAAQAELKFKAGEAEKDRRNKLEIAAAQEEGRDRRNKENNEFKAKEGARNRASTHPREFRSYDRYGRERWFEDQDAADDFYGQEDYERRLAEWIAGGRVGERPNINPDANRLEGMVETQSVKPKYNYLDQKVGTDTTVTRKPEKIRVAPSRHVDESKGKGYGNGDTDKGKGY